MTAPTDEPTGAMLLALHEYWTRKRGDRAMPSRADLDPLEMIPLLPNVFLVNVAREPLDFVYRLLGTGIVARSLRDYTGMRVDDIPAQRPPSLIWALYQRATEQRSPVSAQIPVLSDSRRCTEQLVAPLSTDGTAVDMLIGVIDFAVADMAEAERVMAF